MIDALSLGATLPVLLPLLAALVCLVVDLVRSLPAVVHLGVALVGLLGGAAAALPGTWQSTGQVRGAFCLTDGGAPAAEPLCLYAAGPVQSGVQVLALVAAAAVLALAVPDWAGRPRGRVPVLTVLLLVATAGAVALPAAQDVGTWWVALELATLPVLALTVLHRRVRDEPRGVDAGLSLLTASLISFALLAMAGALWYAATGSALLTPDAAEAALVAGHRPLLGLALALGVAGLAVKLSLAPFHGWTPVVYPGAPLPVAAFLAATSRVAALGGLLVLVRAVAPLGESPLAVVALLAVLSMTLGNVLALHQRDPVRLLAWLSVAQAGWVALPLATLGQGALPAAAGYLVVQVTAVLVLFGVVIAVRHRRAVSGTAAPRGTGHLAEHRGLLRTDPWLGLPLTLALLTLAGLPPAVIGLAATIVALAPVAGAGLWWAVVLAALNVAIGILVSMRWVFVAARPTDAEHPGARGSAPVPRAHPAHLAVVWVGTTLLVAGSLAPGLLLSLADAG